MTDRLPCTNPTCSRTILPTTAAETGGLCMICRSARRAAERAAALAANQYVVDLYAGLTDPVAMILQRLQPRPFNPLEQVLPPPWSVEDLYASLTPEAAEQLIDAALSALRAGQHDLAETAAQELACYTTYPLDRLLAALLDQDHMPAPIAFRQAGPAIRDRLLRQLAAPVAPWNALLLALAWIGDSVAVQQFAAWAAQPPPWATTLYVPPADYTVEAGWDLTPAGTRRELVLAAAYPLMPLDPPRLATGSAAPAEACPWCSQPLTALVTLDATTPAPIAAALGLAASPLMVWTCRRCVGYALLLTRTTPTAGPIWHPATQRPSSLPLERFAEDALPITLTVVDVPRLLTAGATWGGSVHVSQVGGYPAWIDDAWYPCCPECGVRMRFLAQVAVAEVLAGEGIYYALLCSACRVAATIYQQT